MEKQELTVLKIEDLRPFPGNPFHLVEDEQLMELSESIKEFGMAAPILTRPAEGGNGYEVISGQRRVRASELAGIESVPAFVLPIDRDRAIITLVDSNIQRENILPSERAFAYKMKLDAMKRQGYRTDLTSNQVGTKLQTDEIVAKGFGVSKTTVHRFIRLTELTPVSLKEANAFVAAHHRHHKPTRGHKFSIGCAAEGRLVGVAIVGRPVSRYLDNGLTLEVTRLCTRSCRTPLAASPPPAPLKWRLASYQLPSLMMSATGTPSPAASFPAVFGSQVPRRMMVLTFWADMPQFAASSFLVRPCSAITVSIRCTNRFIVSPQTIQFDHIIAVQNECVNGLLQIHLEYFIALW